MTDDLGTEGHRLKMKNEECIFNCCFEPAYTIEHIVEAMKKLAGCGYKFKWSFEEALEDWFNDNGRQYLK